MLRGVSEGRVQFLTFDVLTSYGGELLYIHMTYDVTSCFVTSLPARKSQILYKPSEFVY